MTHQERSEWIEKYLKGSLSGKDLIWFESQLKEDLDLAKELALQKDILTALTEKDIIDFRKKLQAVNDEVSSEKSKSSRVIHIRDFLGKAAGVLLLIAAGILIFFYLQKKSYSPEELYQAYFTAPETIQTSSGIDRDTATVRSSEAQEKIMGLWSQVDSLYQMTEYQNAFDFINALPEEIKERYPSDINYQRGILALLSDQPDSAVTYLSSVETGYDSKKNWYKALALLKIDGKEEEAKRAFEEIAASKNPFQTMAIEILEKMD
ncbi:MAG: hypothetical protein DWQ02_22605 [Bacteroidetes bacterium]|nr:MAG: hypothetical protein DWQ02_22605 [Bacteroidota bacterium]